MRENDAVLKARFGRVVHGNHEQDDRGPYIGRNGIGIEKILNLVDRGLSDSDICARLNGVERKDILASKAYRVRFLEGVLTDAYPDKSDTPYFILDENISYLVLPEVFRLFGRSTSVLAEGLYYQRNSDEHDVWKFAVDNGYKAVLTNDSDFRGIARRAVSDLSANFREAAALPKVIMVPQKMNVEALSRLLEINKPHIDEVISNNEPCATYRIADDGLVPLDLYEQHLQVA